MSKSQSVKVRKSPVGSGQTTVRIKRTTLRQAIRFAKEKAPQLGLSTAQVLEFCINNLPTAH